jgi:DNA-binding ferritin-like protein (Dps family)
MEQTINLYQQIINNLKNGIDQNFKNQLIKEKRIETLDSKWKAARKNIERYLQQIASQNVGLEDILLSDRFFLYEDVAALLIDLLWQDLHGQLDTKETLYFYRYYKIQISNKYLLTDKQN